MGTGSEMESSIGCPDGGAIGSPGEGSAGGDVGAGPDVGGPPLEGGVPVGSGGSGGTVIGGSPPPGCWALAVPAELVRAEKASRMARIGAPKA
ncbi:MAG TPA: hypothetical protein VK988_00920 [Acidimicrobiales bacterium]|nr:hypothetical protein [Acidimicrobiales bacterium]